MTMAALSLADITGARERIAGRVHVTPVLSSGMLAAQAGVGALWLKCESLQKTGSFKVRGSLNAVSRLDAAARERGVVTFSAGNHAQALAWAATSVGVRSAVVMPATASETKAAASAAYGAEVIRHGTGAEAFARAMEIAAERGMTLVHPFEDPLVAAGAGTTGLELLEQVPSASVVVVPIGGGGLIAGIASAVKALRPDVRVIGVEPEGAAVMRQSLDAGRALRMQAPPKTIADGLAAPFAGEFCFEIVRRLVDDVVLVTDDEIASAMSLLLTRAKVFAEPAGAAATAALLARRVPSVDGCHVVSIVSGGNVDLDRFKALV
jgi:threonine dehydratase